MSKSSPAPVPLNALPINVEPLNESNRGPILIVLAVLASLIALAVLFAVIGNRLFAPVELPDQTSPDGSWTIRLVGRPTWNGSVEISGSAYDHASGSVRGPSVVGLTESIEEFRTRYASLAFEGNTAQCDGVTVMNRPVPGG